MVCLFEHYSQNCYGHPNPHIIQLGGGGRVVVFIGSHSKMYCSKLASPLLFIPV